MIAKSFNSTLHCPKRFKIKKVEETCLNIPLHNHDSYEFLYIEEGFGTRIVGDHTGGFAAGDMVLVGPNLPHTFQTDEIFQRGLGYVLKANVIYFNADFLFEMASEFYDSTQITVFLKRALRGVSFHGASHFELSGKLKDISEVTGLEKTIRCLEIIDLLINATDYSLLTSPAYHNSFAQKDTGRFNVIYQYIIGNFQNEISLDKIASVANMSPKSFCRYFKKRTDKTLVQFINELRIEHACYKLRNLEYSVSEVCYDSGYNNITHFNNCFKQYAKMSPSEYRKDFQLIEQPGAYAFNV